MSHPDRTLTWLNRRLLGTLALLFGVTLVSFTLTAHFGPDQTWELLGRNPTPEQVEQVRHQLGYDRPFLLRYTDYLFDLARLDLGHARATGEPVAQLLARSVPVSLALLMPGFVIGIGLALALALAAAWKPGGALDRLCQPLSAATMSLSLVVIVIALQAVFGVWLNWLPVRGWTVEGPADWMAHAALPTLAMVLANLGYNLRFFRGLFRETLNDPPVRTARAFGLGRRQILLDYVLRATAVPIVTRIVFALPLILISGSLIIERHFGIPGIGRVTYQAVLSGDQPVLMAVVSLGAITFALAMTVADVLARLLDPRIRPT